VVYSSLVSFSFLLFFFSSSLLRLSSSLLLFLASSLLLFFSASYFLSVLLLTLTHSPLNFLRQYSYVEAKVISEEGKELGVNERGELCFRCPNMMLGYLNRPDENILTTGER
jgi:acyl-CoA synthetase (AMP-forming)/AMP-acid ligase II